MTESPLMDSGFAVPVFSPGDDPIACLNKTMTFLTAVASSRFPSTNNQLKVISFGPWKPVLVSLWPMRHGSRGDKVKVILVLGIRVMLLALWEIMQVDRQGLLNATTIKVKDISLGNALSLSEQGMQHDLGVPDGQVVQTIIPNTAAFQTEDLDTYDSDYDDLSNAQAVLMANIFNYGYDVISEMDDMIREKLALKEQVDSLAKSSNQMRRKGALTLSVFCSNIHSFQKKLSGLNQTCMMVSDKHVVMPLIDDEETLILEEKSRSKMSEKAKDPEIIDKNISHKPIDYEKLNRLSEDFGKRFTPQQEMDAEQAFWLRISNLTSKPSDASTIKTTPDARTKVFNQMDAVVQQFLVDKQCLKIAKKELLLENDRLLQQIMSQEVLLTVMNSMSLIGESVNMDGKRKETCNLEAELLKSQNAFNDLLKRHSQLEKHCISLECSIQLNQEIFQKRESCDNQNALEILEFFAYNDLKAQLQDKDSTICKLKDMIKSMREKSKDENVKYDYCEIETKNVELENSVAKLLSENERLCNEINHVKQVFKEQFDSIKKTRVRSKEQSDSLIDKLNLKSAENEDLKAQIQDKVFVITSLKNDLRKIKGKEIVDIASQIPSANTIVPGMFKLDLEPLAPRLLQNREAHIDYLKYTQEQADILREIVKQAKVEHPLDKDAKKVAVTPKNKVKKVGLPDLSILKQTVNRLNVVQIVLWYLDSGCSKHMTGNRSQLMNFVSKFLGTVRFGNDHIARIMGYGDYQLGNVTISRVYYVEGLGHNLFSVGQFCDGDLEVAFRKNTCFIRNLEGVDLLSGSRDTNLYTISLDDMLKTSLICLLSKASKTKSWLWHRRLSHLNFGKSKKSSHQPKAEDTNQEKLYLLHMDLCGPMRVASINGKRSGSRLDTAYPSVGYGVLGISWSPQEANQNAGTKDIFDACDSEKEAESAQDFFVLPISFFYSSIVKRSTAKDAGEAPNKHPDLKTDEKPVDKEDQVFLDELERLKRQEKDANDAAEALRKEFAQETEDLLLQAGAVN
ncbi:hypothetical protein Tco_1355114 [Tanacetum coccineum]